MGSSVNDNENWLRELQSAWARAGSELGFQVIAPFVFKGPTRNYQCDAYLPHFGSEKGMLIQGMLPPEFETDEALAADAKSAGVYISFVNAHLYARFDAEHFKDTLTDWGFFGPPQLRPRWMH